jgi:hypothetical protein
LSSTGKTGVIANKKKYTAAGLFLENKNVFAVDISPNACHILVHVPRTASHLPGIS